MDKQGLLELLGEAQEHMQDALDRLDLIKLRPDNWRAMDAMERGSNPYDLYEYLTAEEVDEERAWSSACEQAVEAWAERRNEYWLTRVDDLPHMRPLPAQPSWYAWFLERWSRAEGDCYEYESAPGDDECPF